MDRPPSPSDRVLMALPSATQMSRPSPQEAQRIADSFTSFPGFAFPTQAGYRYPGLPHDAVQVSPRTVVPDGFDRGYWPQSPYPRVWEVEDDEAKILRRNSSLHKQDDHPTGPRYNQSLHQVERGPNFPLIPCQRGNTPPRASETRPATSTNAVPEPNILLSPYQRGNTPPRTWETRPATSINSVPDLRPYEGTAHRDATHPTPRPPHNGTSAPRKPESPSNNIQEDHATTITTGSYPSCPWSSDTTPDDGFVSYVLNSVHAACLAATQRHLVALRTNWHLRTCTPQHDVHEHDQGQDPRHARHRASSTLVGRFSPYLRPSSNTSSSTRRRRRSTSPFLVSPGQSFISNHAEAEDEAKTSRQSSRQPPNPIPLPTHSLLENIHIVTNLLWRRARRDRLDVLDAEREALAAMEKLTQWAEDVVFGCGAVDEPLEDGEWDRESVQNASAQQVITAGVQLCQMLDDADALRQIVDVQYEMEQCDRGECAAGEV